MSETIETRFGSFPANVAAVISIPDGLPGFERCRRYVVISVPEFAPFACLQGLDDPRPSFLTIDPRLVDASYAAKLSAVDLKRLGANDGDNLLWLSLVRLEDDRASVNLRAPVVVNPMRLTGLQVIAADSPYSTEYALVLD